MAERPKQQPMKTAESLTPARPDVPPSPAKSGEPYCSECRVELGLSPLEELVRCAAHPLPQTPPAPAADYSCADLDAECPDCGGTGEKVRACSRCGVIAMRARLDHGGYSGLPIIGRKCDECGLVEPPTYLRGIPR